MEASHGKEEKRQESGKEKEKEESGTKEREKKVAEETRKKSGQEKVRPKKGETQRKGGQESRNAGSDDGGIGGGHSPFGSGDARRGENCPEPGGCMALSDWFQAIKRVGSEPRSVRGPLCPGLSRGRSARERGIGPSSCLIVSVSGLVLG